MKPVRTQELIDFGARRGYTVEDHYGHYADLYCWWCGTAMVITIGEGVGFDTRTGKPLHEAFAQCPRRPMLLGFLTKHRKEKIKLDQDEMSKLLYDYVLDVTIPETQ